MTLQQISTPSVLEIKDSNILASNAHTPLDVESRDPWSSVLTQINLRSIDLITLDGIQAATSPEAANPFITKSLLESRFGIRGLILIGQPSSDADFEGSTEAVFQTAIASLPNGGVIAVLQGTYIFSSTLNVPSNIRIIGIHPLSVVIQGIGDFSLFDLGENSGLECLTVENTSCLSYALINLLGYNSFLLGCRIQNYGLFGVKISGSKSSVKYCLLDSEKYGILFQGYYQTVECCSFSNTHAEGVFRFESSNCSIISNFIHSTVIGASFSILSPSYLNNKIIANHLGTATAIDASLDSGTNTVRYANTPDTPHTNESTFLLNLKKYTGQPNLNSTEMSLTNDFAHNSASDKNAVSILSSLDLFTQRIYEERNWYLTSTDPTFNSLGEAVSGAFTWNGTNLTWPNFSICSLIPSKKWTISASSSPINVGEALVVDLDRTILIPTPVTPIIKPLSLVLENTYENQVVLAYSPYPDMLVWTNKFSLFLYVTGNVLSFDIDGLCFPIHKFIGVGTDLRNIPTTMPDAFSIGDNLTEKVSNQSKLLKLLYERTNLWESSDSSIDTFPKIGDWLDLTQDIPPESPSHLLQIKGSTYALFPNNGLYTWNRDTNNWSIIGSCPVSTPFASMSLVSLKLAVLASDGNIVTWDVDTQTWETITPPPTLSSSLSLPFPNIRPITYDAAGQSDFIFQTPYYSLFTLLDGKSVLYFKESNALMECPRVFTETPKGAKLLGRHLKDTGFNVTRETPWLDTSDNGSYSTLEGLPLSSNAISNAFEISPDLWSPTLAEIKWDELKQESCSFDPNSGAFLDVVYSDTNPDFTYYILAGGYGWAKLCSIVTINSTSEFLDFNVHGWITNIGNMEIFAFGSTVPNKEFTVIHGKYLSSPLGSSSWVWTRNVLGGVNSNNGAFGILNRAYGYGNGNIHILASDASRNYRPTHWQYSQATSTWTSTRLAEDGSGDYTLTQAVQFSFLYSPMENQAGYPVIQSDDISIKFLIRDISRLNRPTLIEYDGIGYTGETLSEIGGGGTVEVEGADTASVLQFYGGMYQKAWDASIWITRSIDDQIKIFFYFLTPNTWHVMSVGTGGTYLSTTDLGTPTFKQRSNPLATQLFPTEFSVDAATKDIFVWTQTAGLLKGSITANYLTGNISSASWEIYDKRIPTTSLPLFPTDPSLTTYSPTVGVSRNDLSIQFGSIIEKTKPVFGVGISESKGNVLWFDTGSKVRQITPQIWVGLNRKV